MELEGLKRSRAALDDANIRVGELTTDRHTQIKKYVENEWSEVQHYFDIWHIAKGAK